MRNCRAFAEMRVIYLILRGMLYDFAQKKLKIKSAATGRVMTLNIWACRFSAQSASDSQISEGYTVCRIYSVPGLQEESRIPFCNSSSQCLPQYQEGHYYINVQPRKKIKLPVLFSVASGDSCVPRRMKCDCRSQEIVVCREDRSKGTLYKSEEEKSGLGVKTMDKVSLATKVHLV